ncbi:hypothetical protein F4781DRAFT_133673 [Annulohypoxylon bovei var. microspora]|nr:hypothetical protein F4781DRAFT_133673 [Annulohypoxylon bovei var. microspora]
MEESQISTKKPKQEQTFTSFSNLPKELRDMIWDFAIRDERPGAHFFLLGNLCEELNAVDLKYEQIHSKEEEKFPIFALRYSVDATDGFPRTTYNQSAYLIDSGLWTACRESRDAMQRRFRRAEHDPSILLSRVADGPTGRTGTFTTYGDGDEREDRPFAIMNHGLLCLQNLDGQYEKCERCEDAIAQLGDDIPFLKQHGYGKPFRDGVGHIAVEFDPNWKMPDEYHVAYDKRFSRSVCHVPNLWFIDYRIRRSKDPARSRAEDLNDPYIFYGNGCRFVSVHPKETEWEFEDGTLLSTQGHNVFGFVNELAKSHHLTELGDVTEDPNSPGDYQDYFDEFEFIHLWDNESQLQLDESNCNLGVLAFETWE